MWAKLEPNSSTWEPNELIKLKQKLAHLTCKCASCEKTKFSSTMVMLAQRDKQVQVEEPKRRSFDQFTQVSPDTMVLDHNQFLNTLTKDVLCPRCYLTMNLLRGGALRVLKDEESETKAEMFCCNKSTEQYVKATEKSTSISNKLTAEFSNLSMCDFTREASVYSVPACYERRSSQQVKFIGMDRQKTDNTVPFDGDCLCLENFIDSIRPPLVDSFMKQ